MASLYHVFLRPKSGVTNDQVEKVMNLAVDWYKYSQYCWVLKTTSDAAKWQTRLKPLVEPEGSLLIFKLDPTQRQGWIAKDFWEWLKKDNKRTS